MALSEQERNYIEQAFMRGPTALLEQGWTLEQVQKFFERADVRREMEVVLEEFRGRESYAARLKFGLKRRLSRFGSGATAVLGAALAGPIYVRDKQGNVLADAKGHPMLRETGPTRGQIEAATEILDRIGLMPEGRGTAHDHGSNLGDVNLQILVKSNEEVRLDIETSTEGATEEEKALSRERMRTFIELTAKKLPLLRKKAKKITLKGSRKKGGQPCPGEKKPS